MTAQGLALARDVLGANLPSEVQTWFTTQPEAPLLAARLRASLVDHATHQATNEFAIYDSSKARMLMQAIDSPTRHFGFFMACRYHAVDEGARYGFFVTRAEFLVVGAPSRPNYAKKWILNRSHGKAR